MQIIKRLFLFLILLLIGMAPLKGEAASINNPLEIGAGARSIGVGRAFTSFSGDATSVFYNPSGLATLSAWHASTMSLTLLQDVRYLLGTVAVPLEDGGTLGLGYVGQTTSGISETNSAGQVTGTASFANTVFLLSYAQPTPYFEQYQFLKGLRVGGTLKFYNQGFSGGSGALASASGNGLDLDLGAQVRPHAWLTVGFSQLNTLPTSMGGKFTWSTGAVDGISSVTKLGASVMVLGDRGLYPHETMQLRLSLDGDFHLSDKSEPTTFHLGGEWWPTSMFALRAGIDQQPESGGSAGTVTVSNQYALGVGLRFDVFSFDYAYRQLSGNLADNNAHFFSVNLIGESRFRTLAVQQGMGGGDKEVLPVEVTEEGLSGEDALDLVQEEMAAVESVPLPPQVFDDVDPTHWAYVPITTLARAGFIDGFPDGTYRPEETLSRGEMAALLVRLKEIYTDGKIEYLGTEPPFRDLAGGHWSKRFVAIAYENGWLSGYGDGTFRPSQALTRAEAVTIVAKFDGLDHRPLAKPRDPFPDMPYGKHWSTLYVLSAQEVGLLDYLQGLDFEPEHPFTRAEAAYVVSRISFVKPLLVENQ